MVPKIKVREESHINKGKRKIKVVTEEKEEGVNEGEEET